MNNNWRNRPTYIEFFPQGVDYFVGIDESGNSNIKNVIEAREKGTPVVDNEKNFTIVACRIKRTDFETARDMVMGVKNKHWNEGLFDYKGTNKRVCFHSNEIRSKKNAFSPSVINYDDFILDLSDMMAKVPIEIYGAHINKEKLVTKYNHPAEPYDLGLTFIFERLLMDMKSSEKCIIVLEARGKKEDKALLEWIKNLIDNGNMYNNAEFFKKIVGVYFNPKWSQVDDEKKSYWELELADLCAYPINKFFTKGIKDRSFVTLEDKIACSPNYMRRGLKSFP